MTYKALVAISAPALLAIILLLFLQARRRGTADPAANAPWSLWRLLLASFLTLFAELALIRWIAVEVRIFAYFKNLTLLLCFLGFGFGCALARARQRWAMGAASLMALLLIVRGPLRYEAKIDQLSQQLGYSSDAYVWRTQGSGVTDFLLAAVACGCLMLLITMIFVPLGQAVSQQFNVARRTLAAYSWNLFGSLLGILAFFVVCRFMSPPTLWLPTVLIGFALLQVGRREQWVLAAMAVPAFLLLYEPATPDHYSFWTPYQQIEFKRDRFKDGEPERGSVFVNHAGYQWIVNLAPEFIHRHPQLMQERLEDNPYNLPFRFATPHPSVLIVGAGSGNDTAAALRNGSASVDAVEIDPAIVQLGKREHPERPYQSAKVAIHVEDARSFLNRTHKRYDLILFGLLDSHTQVSDYANMRLDNFVYTRESFREARAHLAPDGVLFVKFQVDLPWIGKRMHELLTDVFGKPPLVFKVDSSYTVGATCFVISPSGRVESALAADSRLAGMSAQAPAFVRATAVPMTSDDWPYLYQERRRIPRVFFSVTMLVLLLGLGLYVQVPEARRQSPSLFFFAMGAGFLLLESLVISRLALYFGTTWQVNGVVIAALLSTLLVSNLVVEKWGERLRPRWVVAGLLASLVAAYLMPTAVIGGSATLTGIGAAIIFSIPVFFAGVLFATEFRRAPSPSAALASNILGSVVGGLLENLSFVTGMRALLLVALVLYSVAALARAAGWRKLRGGAGAPAIDAELEHAAP